MPRQATIVLPSEVHHASGLTETRLALNDQALDRGVDEEEDVDADQHEQVHYVDCVNIVKWVLLQHVHSVTHRDVVQLN